MKIKNVTIDDINNAVCAANAAVGSGDNIYLQIEDITFNRGGREVFRGLLKVRDSRGKGARRSASGRRIACACWHAFGYFVDALPEGAVVLAGGKTIRPGDQWEDWQAGSRMNPIWFSDLCECAE